MREEKILISDEIPGMLALPKQSNHQYPAVLMLHGFASDKDEVGGLYKSLSANLVSKDIASLRIDFRGWGESKMSSLNITVDSLLEDAKQAYDYLTMHPEIDTSNIGLCGFSLGAGIAVLTATAGKRKVESMVLLSPAGDLVEDFRLFLGEGPWLSNQDQYEINLDWRNSFSLSRAFFDSLECHHPLSEIKGYGGNLLTIACENDFTAENAAAYIANSSNESNSITYPDGDHIFNITGNTFLANKLIDEVVAEFSKQAK
jgi:uncharacterized protein